MCSQARVRTHTCACACLHTCVSVHRSLMDGPHRMLTASSPVARLGGWLTILLHLHHNLELTVGITADITTAHTTQPVNSVHRPPALVFIHDFACPPSHPHARTCTRANSLARVPSRLAGSHTCMHAHKPRIMPLNTQSNIDITAQHCRHYHLTSSSLPPNIEVIAA